MYEWLARRNVCNLLMLTYNSCNWEISVQIHTNNKHVQMVVEGMQIHTNNKHVQMVS